MMPGVAFLRHLSCSLRVASVEVLRSFRENSGRVGETDFGTGVE